VLQSSLSFEAITTQASQTLIEKGWLVDYITLVKQSDLTLAHRGQDQELVCLAAAKLGITRLIDNLEISLTSFAQKT
jgi:pantoate--beta-alanine ligase